jgi:hypothetical protein
MSILSAHYRCEKSVSEKSLSTVAITYWVAAVVMLIAGIVAMNYITNLAYSVGFVSGDLMSRFLDVFGPLLLLATGVGMITAPFYIKLITGHFWEMATLRKVS